MRVLLDESLPRDLAERLTGHQVETVHDRGWDGLTNGELLRVSAAAGSDRDNANTRAFAMNSLSD